MTPKEQQIYHLPQVQDLIQKLDCIPLLSKREIFNKAVEERVKEMIEKFQDAIDFNPVKRTVIKIDNWLLETKSSLIRSNEEIEAYLVSFYGPRPWKYPLTIAPF